MAQRIKGITVEIGGDTVGLQNALQDVNTKTRDVQKELNDVNKLLKFDPSNTELLAQKQVLLNKQFENSKEKLEQLRTAEADVQEQFEKGEIKEEQYRAFQREIVEAEGKLKYFESQLEKSQSKMQSFGEKMKEAGGKLKNAGGKMTDVGKNMSAKVTAPILGVATALGVAAVKAGQFADSLLDNQSITGVSVETLQAYERMEARAGMGAGTLSDAVGKLNKKFADGELDMKKAEVAVGKLGMSFDEFVALPAEEKMDTLMTQMQGMEQQDRIDLANMLGVEDLLPALDIADKEWGAFKDEMGEGAISEEDLGTMATFSNGLAEMGQQLKLALTKALIPMIEKFEEFRPVLEEKLMPVIEKVGEWLAKLVEWFFELDSSIQIAIGVIIAIIAAIGPLLLIIAPMITLIGSLVTIVGALGLTMGALVTPILIAIGVIAAIIAIGILLYKNWDTIVEKGGELVANIKKKFEEFKTGVKNKMEETKTKISEIWEKVMSFFTDIDLKQMGKDIIQGLIDGILSMATAVADAAKNIASGIGDKIKGILKLGSPSKLLMEMGQDTGEGLAIGLKNSMDQIKEMSGEMANAAVPNLEKPERESGTTAGSSKQMVVNIHSPKALDVREANRQFNRTLNKMSLMW